MAIFKLNTDERRRKLDIFFDDENISLYLRDLIYCEIKGVHLILYLTNDKIIKSKSGNSSCIDILLKLDDFIMLENHIVNIAHISKLSQSYIILCNNKKSK